MLDRLRTETRYTEEQIRQLKQLYANYAEVGRGLNFTRFKRVLAAVFNIENHPFAEDFFLFSDTSKDGLVDFYELVVAMDVIERGAFEDKCKFCFAMYDVLENGMLDIFTLRECLKKGFINQIMVLEKCVARVKDTKGNKHSDGWLWPEFETQVLPQLETAMPLALDRMEFHRALVNEMEYKFNFTLECAEQLWNMYKGTLNKPVSENRIKTAMAFSAHSPELVTKEQFKLIMFNDFKVKDALTLNNLFMVADVQGHGALDIRELLGNIIFWLRGTLGYKFALFFEVFSSVN